jgi:hypothetical protein
MDPMMTPPDAMTMSGSLHSLAAVLGDGVPIGAALITWSLVRNNRAWSPARWPLVTTAALAWAGVVVMSVTLAAVLSQNGGQPGPNISLGWPARFMIAASISWIMTLRSSQEDWGGGPRENGLHERIDRSTPARTLPPWLVVEGGRNRNCSSVLWNVASDPPGRPAPLFP